MKTWMDARNTGWLPTLALLLAVLALTPLLAACGVDLGSQPQVVVVTATSTQQQSVIVVTATFTPAAPQQPATAVVLPPAPTEPAPTADLVATQVAVLKAAEATLTAQAPTATNTPVPTDTPLPPTNTPKPKVPTNTPKPRPTNTPANLARPTIVNPPDGFNCWMQRGQGCDFVWSWAGTLAQNQYFQVQLIGPNNEHRGIQTPTKGYSFHSSRDVWQNAQDWGCNDTYYCDLQWTVSIIEWDGVDPSKIGRRLTEAVPRWIKL